MIYFSLPPLFCLVPSLRKCSLPRNENEDLGEQKPRKGKKTKTKNKKQKTKKQKKKKKKKKRENSENP